MPKSKNSIADRRGCECNCFMIGIWDAVAAIGWQRFFPDWAYDRHFAKDVRYARHLQSIDEGRTDFKRVPWGVAAAPSWSPNGKMNRNSSVRFGSLEITQI